MRRTALWILTVALALALPAGADAARVVSSNGQLTYTAGVGEPNTLTVTASGGQVVFEDATAQISARSGCAQLGPRKAACAPGTLTVLLGDRDDRVAIGAVACHACVGGPGADTVTGGNRDDELTGSDGADVVSGGDGADALRGMAGEDELDGGRGPDSIAGGADTDTVSYTGREAPGGCTSMCPGVSISLDGVQNDGNADDGGSRDLIGVDVENAVGTKWDDSLSGSPVANALNGAAGDDSLDGGDGADILSGGGGADEISGDAGDDTVTYADRINRVSVTIGVLGGNGNALDGPLGDSIANDVENAIGGTGNDTLAGSKFIDRLEGGDGKDTITGGNGEDTIEGGAGDDLLDGGDAGDEVRGDEETTR